jgi:hypothetical protein
MAVADGNQNRLPSKPCGRKSYEAKTVCDAIFFNPANVFGSGFAHILSDE